MAILNFHGSATPPGTWTVGTDGDPRIVAGSAWYFTTGSPLRGKNIVGGRAWVPAGKSGETIQLALWRGGSVLPGAGSGIDLSGTPLQTKNLVLSNNAAHWAEVTWDTPQAISTDFYLYGVSVEYITAAGDYHFGSNVRADGGPTAHSTVGTWWWSENGGPYVGVYFRQGTGVTAAAVSQASSYGADILIDDGEVANDPPTANAGANQSVATNVLVTLNGSGSSDPDGTISTYTWSQVSGPSVTLAGSGSNRTFTPTAAGTYVFGLTVTDNGGATSAQDQVTITVTDIPNEAPTANAGPDQTVAEGTEVTLTGAASTDSDGTIATYAWTLFTGPLVTLSGTGATRTFTPTTPGVYVFRLTVTDDVGASGQDTVTITVTATSTVDTIAEENANAGHGREFWLDGITQEVMPAFSRSTYYLPGATAEFSVDYNSAFTFDVFRLGHYADAGGRRVDTAVAGTPTTQPPAVAIPDSNGAVTCAAWSVNAVWPIPATAVPGWYQIVLHGTSGDLGSVLFCVSDASDKKPVLVVTGEATWHAAYNGYGSNNVYGAAKGVGSGGGPDRALCSTYDKPVITKDYVAQTHFFNNTYPYLKWSERMGIEAGHTTIEQIKDDPTVLDGRAIIAFVGHNEYIPDAVYDKVEALIAAGQKIINAAGNDFFWRVKYTDGAFDSLTDGRVMWCKKDTMPGPGGHIAGQPFTTMADWTGTWQDTRWTLRRPSEDVFGDQFIANGIRSDAVAVPAAMKTSPAWRDCAGIQALATGAEYTFAVGTLGMEWDRPVLTNTNVEQELFSTVTIDLTNNASDANGQVYTTTVADALHGFAMVRNGSGLIANFNSDQWSWSLDSLHLRGSAAEDANAMQMMLNILYDLGARADAASVSAASLTVPTPVANPYTDYGLTDPNPAESGGEDPGGEEPGTGAIYQQLVDAGYVPYIIVAL